MEEGHFKNMENIYKILEAVKFILEFQIAYGPT